MKTNLKIELDLDQLLDDELFKDSPSEGEKARIISSQRHTVRLRDDVVAAAGRMPEHVGEYRVKVKFTDGDGKEHILLEGGKAR